MSVGGVGSRGPVESDFGASQVEPEAPQAEAPAPTAAGPSSGTLTGGVPGWGFGPDILMPDPEPVSKKILDKIKDPECGNWLDKICKKKEPDFEQFVTMSKVGEALGKDVPKEYQEDYQKHSFDVAKQVAMGQMTPEEGLKSLIKAQEGLKKLEAGAQPWITSDGSVIDANKLFKGLKDFKPKEFPKNWEKYFDAGADVKDARLKADAGIKKPGIK